MTVASNNIFPKVTLVEGAAPSSPAATNFSLYFDSSDHLLKWKNSAGTVTTVASSGGNQTFVGCFAYNSTTQSFGATTLTYMALNAEAYDTSTFHDNATNNSRMVAPTTGYYRITGGIWYATTTGTNYVLIDKNHSGTYLRGGVIATNGGSSGVRLTFEALLTAGDYVEMSGYHTEAGTTVTGDTGTTISQQNFLSIQLLGV